MRRVFARAPSPPALFPARAPTSTKVVLCLLLGLAHGLCAAAPWCAASLATRAVRAQGSGPSNVQISYRAPATCPTRDAFAARLQTRLAGAARATDKPVVLTVELLFVRPSRAASPAGSRAMFWGSITLSDAHGVLGPRAIEAASCSEAVDALTFVSALLLEDRAHAAEGTSARARTPAPAAAGRTRRTRGPEATATTTPSSEAASSTDNESNEPTEPSVPAPPTREPALAEPAPKAADAEREPSVPPANASAPARSDEAETEASRRPRALALRGSLAVAGLAVSGVAPAVRPGVGLSAGLAVFVGRAFALSVALGLRAALPHHERSLEGDGTFLWWSTTLAVCAAARSATDAARVALCLDGEAGQIRANGRATDDPNQVHPAWLGLGPAARTSLRLFGRWRLVPGVSLLVPSARDRFVVGASELHRVSRLTFRGELGVAVEWP